MARYIDESKLIQAIIKERDKIPLTRPCASYELLDEKPSAFGQAQRSGIRKALRCIAETPTADVVEVKHGEWKMAKYPITECTNCHIIRDCEHEKGWEFCPNCGAKMDGERK